MGPSSSESPNSARVSIPPTTSARRSVLPCSSGPSNSSRRGAEAGGATRRAHPRRPRSPPRSPQATLPTLRPAPPWPFASPDTPGSGLSTLRRTRTPTVRLLPPPTSSRARGVLLARPVRQLPNQTQGVLGDEPPVEGRDEVEDVGLLLERAEEGSRAVAPVDVEGRVEDGDRDACESFETRAHERRDELHPFSRSTSASSRRGAR